MDCFTSWSKFAFYGIPERPRRGPETVVFPKKAKFSDKSRHLSISRPKHVAGPIGDQSQVLYPFHVKKEVKGVVNQRYCPEYPYTNLVHLDEMAAELGINMLVFDKKELSRKLPSWRIGENWHELDLGGKFIPSSQEKDFEVIL